MRQPSEDDPQQTTNYSQLMEITECDEFVVTQQSSSKRPPSNNEYMMVHSQHHEDASMFDQRMLSRGQILSRNNSTENIDCEMRDEGAAA